MIFFDNIFKNNYINTKNNLKIYIKYKNYFKAYLRILKIG